MPGERAKFTFSGTHEPARKRQRRGLGLQSARISLLEAGLSTLASTTVSPAGGFLDTTVLPVRTGTYTVVVDPSGGPIGAVTLHARMTCPRIRRRPSRPGGPPVTVTTTVPGQNAYLTFTGTAGQRVSVLVSNVLNGSTPAELDLQNANGTHAIAAPADGDELAAPGYRP